MSVIDVCRYTFSPPFYSALTNKLMVRVTNYFDAQIRVPIAASDTLETTTPNGTSTAFQTHLREAINSTKPMSNDQLISWYAKILEGVKQRYRKLQRLAR